MKKGWKEFLVGCLVLGAVALLVAFGWVIGVVGPLGKEVHYSALYSFAGGVEVGSPVRVSGVKVGKVEKIEFIPVTAGGEPDPVTLKLKISVSGTAAPSVREDSKFFVNMAGIIGERYIEISPGSASTKALPDGATLRGIDPPRIDQLLSQGYGVFGQIETLLANNSESMTTFVSELDHLLKDANRFLRTADRKKIFALIENMNDLSMEIKDITKGLKDPETKEIYHMLFELVRRAHSVDKPALKKFFQDEGIRAHIF